MVKHFPLLFYFYHRAAPGTVLGDYCKDKGLYDGNYEDIQDNFFDTSVLNFSDERKEQLECLQKVFALAVETQCMPTVEELTRGNVLKYVHRAMRFTRRQDMRCIGIVTGDRPILIVEKTGLFGRKVIRYQRDKNGCSWLKLPDKIKVTSTLLSFQLDAWLRNP